MMWEAPLTTSAVDGGWPVEVADHPLHAVVHAAEDAGRVQLLGRAGVAGQATHPFALSLQLLHNVLPDVAARTNDQDGFCGGSSGHGSRRERREGGDGDPL
eukprot:CAMPEP_0180146750 /NCGR_PEP_ID=MMETSP0986-20121125/18750_1 /TAXON_ID=697907 /ORGANISM="non described non described, Strain CCMP2293" /LENGTH=100 /DNA_ID=CAMNT_0022091975 /DNA_START=764 /DNA_END=1065 /DNA_ORIENTATION=+